MSDNYYKALLIDGDGKAELRDFPTPEINGDEVLVEPKYWGICGSDLKLFYGEYNLPHEKGIIPGHEWVGYVKATGNKVTKFKKGERVTGECSIFCDRCYFCTSVNKNLCKKIKKHGISANGFATELKAVNQRYLHSLDNADIDDRTACMIEPAAVVLQGLKKLENKGRGLKHVFILGAGAIGLLSGLMIMSKNPSVSVHIVDVNKKRTDLADAFGMVGVLCDLDALAEIAQEDYYDLLVETSGYKGYVDIVNRGVRPGGEVLLFSQPLGSTIPVELIVTKMISFHGNLGGAGSFEDAIDLIVQNKEKVSKIIDHDTGLVHMPELINNKSISLKSGCKTIVAIAE